MPTTRPSDKGDDESQWWKDAPAEDGEVPEGPAANNQNNAGKNKFNQEMHEVKRPT